MSALTASNSYLTMKSAYPIEPPHAEASAAVRQHTERQHTEMTAAAAFWVASDDLETASLHYRFVQNVRLQIEEEYKAATDAEAAAKTELDAKRRRVGEAEESHKRLRSDNFRKTVRAKGAETCGHGLLTEYATAKAAFQSAKAAERLASDYYCYDSAAGAADELEEGEIREEDAFSFSPKNTPPASPRY